MIEKILSKLQLGQDGIYSYEFKNIEQNVEIKLRESVASHAYQDYLHEISKHHSVPVMDREVKLFLNSIPQNGIIIDVGGGWGWHWRLVKNIRPDVIVIIVDFVRSNLIHAKNVLGDYINKHIFLVHGDATSLIFDDNTFDGYWSVQTLQHIPNFQKAINEAWRVLKPGGIFVNYSLNNQALVKLIYKILGRPYHIKGQVPDSFYLARASHEQVKLIEKIFSNSCKRRYSEVIFSPELKIKFPGKEGSIIGKLDCLLSSYTPIFSWIARQQSFHTYKVGS